MSEFETPVPTSAEMEQLIPGMEATGPLVGILMGSESDRPVMEKACAELDERALSYEIRVISAHRNPKEVAAYAEGAALRCIRVLIHCYGRPDTARHHVYLHEARELRLDLPSAGATPRSTADQGRTS